MNLKDDTSRRLRWSPAYLTTGLTALVQIEQKDFQLDIRISQKRLNIDLLCVLYEFLKPIIDTFEAEGARVQMLVEYTESEGLHCIKARLVDVLNACQTPAQEETFAEAYLKKVSIGPSTWHMSYTDLGARRKRDCSIPYAYSDTAVPPQSRWDLSSRRKSWT